MPWLGCRPATLAWGDDSGHPTGGGAILQVKHPKNTNRMLSSSGVIIEATPTRVLALLLFLSVLAVLVIACGGSSPAAISKPESAVTNQAALSLFKRSFEAGESIKSFRAISDIRMRALGENLSISMNIESARNNWSHIVQDLDFPDGEMTVEIIMAPPDVYTKFSNTDMGWLRMDVEALARSAGVSEQLFTNPLDFSNSFFPTDDVPWELYTVTSAGNERIDGVRTEHLKIQVDFQELLKSLTEEQKTRIAQLSGSGGGLAPDELDQIDITTMEFWIDDKALTRRMVMQMDMADGVSLDIDMRMFDFNQDIRIKPPKDYSEFSLP